MTGANPARTSAVGERSLPGDDATARRLFPNDGDPSAGGSMATAPVVDRSVAYGAGIGVEARDVTDGELRWVYDTDDNVECGPALGCGTVYVSTLNETLALDRDDGTLHWESDVGLHTQSNGPVVHDGAVYLAAGDLVALDAESGDELWSGSTEGRCSGVAVDDRAYVTTHGNESGAVAAHGLATGDEQWETTDVGNPYAPPALGPDHVYVVSKPADVYAVSRSDGTVEWHRSLGDTTYSPPAVADGRVFTPAGNGSHVRAFDAASGDLLWRFETGVGQGAPVVIDDAVLVTSANDGCYLLDVETGERLWASGDLGIVNAQPVPVEGKLFYLDERTSEGFVYE